MKDQQVRLQRLRKANKLIEVIASCGREFFRHKRRVSFFEFRNGRLWFVDKYTQRGVYTHYEGRWKGFTEGGTLQCLVKRLRGYVFHGEQLPPGIFGPWPDDYCNGDLWGYRDDMEKVREAARELGITE